MTDPITPPPELVLQWLGEHFGTTVTGEVSDVELHIATQAARWGADQELEACINYFHEYDTSWSEDSELVKGLRAARRPKPPSLKEQALAELEQISIDPEVGVLASSLDTIRRALEQLDD